MICLSHPFCSLTRKWAGVECLLRGLQCYIFQTSPVHFDSDKLLLGEKLFDVPKILLQSMVLSAIVSHELEVQYKRLGLRNAIWHFIYFHISYLRLNHSWKSLNFQIYFVAGRHSQSLRGAEASHLWGCSYFPFHYYVCMMESALMLKVNNDLYGSNSD